MPSSLSVNTALHSLGCTDCSTEINLTTSPDTCVVTCKQNKATTAAIKAAIQQVLGASWKFYESSKGYYKYTK